MKASDLTLEQKIRQTIIVRVNGKEYVPYDVGGVFFGGEIITQPDEIGVEGARQLIKKYIDNADIPILATSDFENGCGGMLKGLTPFPYLMSLGAANDPELAYEYGKATAMEARSVGANWSLSPVSDLNINPWNPLVCERAVGDNPDHTIPILKNVVRGMQEGGIAACAKHFPGDGLDYRDQHRVTTTNSLSFEDWKRLSGRVFQELIDDGIYTIMPGHINLPSYQKERFEGKFALPATLSYELITKLLKEEMGFEGVVVTDALGMGGFVGYYENTGDALVECFKAGCDMMLWPDSCYFDAMKRAIETGYVSMERLDDAVNRILKLKEKLGLFSGDNQPVILSDEEKAYVRDVNRRVAEKSITLVRDDAGNFPMSPDKCKKIAVVAASHYPDAFRQAELLCEELRSRGFDVDYYDQPNEIFKKPGMTRHEVMDSYDRIIYATFSRVYRPSGPEDFYGEMCIMIKLALSHAVDKSIVVSFGSPYFIDEYFQRAKTCVNAYSFVSSSVKAFVRAATGECAFEGISPVKLEHPVFEIK